MAEIVILGLFSAQRTASAVASVLLSDDRLRQASNTTTNRCYAQQHVFDDPPMLPVLRTTA